MTQTPLTPVERGILFILMAEGQPLKQADFKAAHGVEIKKSHRQKLQAQGLVDVNGKRSFTLSLTKRGWGWLAEELTQPKPKGSMGLGPLYAALAAIGRMAKRFSLPLEEALGSKDSLPGPHAGTIILPAPQPPLWTVLHLARQIDASRPYPSRKRRWGDPNYPSSWGPATEHPANKYWASRVAYLLHGTSGNPW
jgi:hypothetical protein